GSPDHVAINVFCWSLISGGPGGAGVPTSSDVANLDGNSGSGIAKQDADMTMQAFSIHGFNEINGTFSGTWSMESYGMRLSTDADLLGGTFIIGPSSIGL